MRRFFIHSRAITVAPIRQWVLLSLAVTVPAGVSSQEPSLVPDSLSLPRALSVGRQSSPLMRMATARRDIAVGSAREVAQGPNPTFEWRRENLGSTLLPDIFTTLYVPVELSGRRRSLRAAASTARLRAEADVTAARRDAEVRIAQAWLRAAAAQQAGIILRDQLVAFSEVERVERARVREGAAAEVSLLRIGLELERTGITHAQARVELTRARAELAVALGLPVDSLPVVGGIPPLALPLQADESISAEMAGNNRPEIRASELAVREASARMSAERRGALGGDWQLQGGSKETGGFRTGQLGIAIPLAAFNRNEGARQRTRGEFDATRVQRDEMLQLIAAEARGSWAAYRVFAERAVSLSTLPARSELIANSMRVAWQEGHATLLELLDAERAAVDTRLMHVRWTVEAWMTRFEYERAIGARLGADSPLDLPLLQDALPPPPSR